MHNPKFEIRNPKSVIRNQYGQIPERPNGADCKSAVFRLRWFESTSAHHQIAEYGFRDCALNPQSAIRNPKCKCGSSSVGRATAFQAVGRGFEPRLPLQSD